MAPSKSFRNGPRVTDSAATLAPVPKKIDDLSPLEIKPEKATRGNTWATSAWLSRPATISWGSPSPNCMGVSSSRSKKSFWAMVTCPYSRAALSLSIL